MNKYYPVFFLFFISCFFSGYSQQDCSSALPICTDGNSGGVVNGFGYDDFNGRTQSGCLSTGLGVSTIETNSYWFKVKLAESGDFGFNIIPNDLSEDWDFAVYGPNATCGALSDPVACNYIKVSASGYTGVGVDPNTGTETTAYDSWMTVNAGEEYLIFVNQYSGSNAGFSIEWTGAVIDNNSAPLDCEILVELGPDRDLCIGDTTVLNATIFGPSVGYVWYKLNETTGVYEVIGAQSQSTLDVVDSGSYQVIVTNNTTGEVRDDTITVTFSDVPIANSVPNLISCDLDGDGSVGFNLEAQTLGIVNGQPGMTVTYHEFASFAEVGVDALTSPYVSDPVTIWARIQNSNNSDCYDVISFDLEVTAPPVANLAPDLDACDDDNNGFMFFDLDLQTPIILNGQPALITYYTNESNAGDRKGWILDTANYNSQTNTIWVRVEYSAGSSCYDLTSFEIRVNDSPTANMPNSLYECDIDNDGFYEFDFRALMDAEILGNQNASTYEVNYFTSQTDADSNSNILPIPYTNKAPYIQETVFARIQNKDDGSCFDTTSFTLQVFDTAMPAAPEDIPDLVYCDDTSDADDTNGFYQFDLTERESTILNGQSSYVFNVTYYQDAGYLNPISNPVAFTNTFKDMQTIYVRVSNSNPNNTNCFADTFFNIEVKPLPNALLTPFVYKQCDEDGTADGFIDFNLLEADEYVALGNNLLEVTYHLSPLEASSGTNSVNKNAFSNQTSPVLYARVTSAEGCYRIVQVDLEVTVTSFPPTYSRQLIACDDDGSNDGNYVFNLAQTRSEILSLFLPDQNVRVSFYRNGADAVSETNSINPDNAYLSETPFNQFIWVRAESTINGGCFGIAPVIELVVHEIPEFELDETAVVCLNETPLIVGAYNSNGFYTYEWTDESGAVISQQQTAEIYQKGVYTVVATSNLGCDSFPQEITITESNIAVITPQDVTINNNSETNSITINNANQNLGIGDYEFSLDDIAGPYQDGTTFNNVIPGEHIVYVQEKNSCGIAQVTIYVFGFPRFFTPNDDGVNDNWNVLGVNPAIFPESIIYVYDRYGNLMANFTATDSGWDGFQNDKRAVSTDYWYLAQMTDTNDVTKEFKGHFSLVVRLK